MIYSGIPYPDPHSLGQTGGTIVLKLTKDFIGKDYTVYAVNFYNSFNLTKHMSSNGTYICGTLRADRKNNPKNVVRKKLGKGQIAWARNETAVVCKWKDKRDVLTISNKHKAELVLVTNRRGKEKIEPNIATILECLVLIGQTKCCLIIKVSIKQFVGIKKLAFIP